MGLVIVQLLAGMIWLWSSMVVDEHLKPSWLAWARGSDFSLCVFWAHWAQVFLGWGLWMSSSFTRNYRLYKRDVKREEPVGFVIHLCVFNFPWFLIVLVDQIRVDDELVYSLDWTRPRPRREDPRSLLLRGRALRGPLPLPVLGLLALPPRLGQVGGDDDEAGARRRTSRRSRVRDDGPRARCGRSSTRRWSWPRTRTSSTSAREPRRPRLRSRLRWGARAVGSRVRPPGRSLGSLGRSPAPVLRSSCSSPSSGCVCVGGKGRWLVRLGEAPRNPGRSPRNLPFLHL